MAAVANVLGSPAENEVESPRAPRPEHAAVERPAVIEVNEDIIPAASLDSGGMDLAPKDDDVMVPTQDQPPKENRTQFIAALTVCIMAGLAFGIGIGFTPFYLTYSKIGEGCTKFLSDEACTTAKFGHCVWTTEPGAQRVANGTILNASCKFSDFREVFCPAFTAPGDCDGPCVYDYSAKKCNHATGFNSAENGFFGASYFIGGTFGPFAVNMLLDRIWFRPVLLMVACVLVFAATLVHISRAADAYWLLVIGRMVLGFGTGGMRLLASVFAFEAVAERPRAALAAAAIQPFTQIGTLFAALYTYFVRPEDYGVDIRLETRIHGQLAMTHLVAVCLALVALIVVKEPRSPKPEVILGAPPQVGQPTDTPKSGGTATPPEAPRSTGAVPLPEQGLFKPLLSHPGIAAVGCMMSLTFMFTGLVPLSAYGPLFSKSVADIDSVQAPLYLSAVAAPAGMIAFFVRVFAKKARPLMLIGLTGIFVSDILIATATMPGAFPDLASSRGVAMAFIAFFFLFEEVCVGSTFFELALALPPPNARAGMSAFLTALLSVHSVVCSLIFPIAVTAISGGPSGNQLYGFSACFYFFAFVAIVGFVLLCLFMHPYKPPAAAPAAAAEGVVAVLWASQTTKTTRPPTRSC
jgi:MFS family permease